MLDESVAHVFDDVAEPAGEHGRRRAAVTLIGRRELLVGQLDERLRRSLDDQLPEVTDGQASPGRYERGGHRLTDDGRTVDDMAAQTTSRRSYSPASTWSPARWRSVIVRAGANGRSSANSTFSYSTFGVGDDQLHPEGDALHGEPDEPGAVADLVHVAERVDHRSDRGFVDGPVADLDEGRLPALADQAAVETAGRRPASAPARSTKPASIPLKRTSRSAADSGPSTVYTLRWSE